MMMAVSRGALLLLVVSTVGAVEEACSGEACDNNDADAQALLQSKVMVDTEDTFGTVSRTISSVDDIDMRDYGLLPEHLDKSKTKIIEGVPVFNFGDTYEGGMNPSLVELAQPKVWIIDFPDSTTDQQIKEFCKGAGNSHCEVSGHPSEHGVPFAVFKGTHDELKAAIKASPKKPRFVESDQEAQAIPEMPDEKHPSMIESDSTGPPSWGLDRIDDAKGLDNDFKLPTGSHAGKGVHVYIADTGIFTSHSDFEGRAIPAIDVTVGSLKECAPTDKTCALDRHGHGTHCAGTVGGKTYGVANKVSLYAVKVLSDRGSGSFSGIINSVDWVASKGQKPAIWSASLGGRGKMNSIEIAFQRALKAGVVISVAAGNSNADACGFSPAFAPTAITVGASNRPSTSGTDPRASFSNYGSCIDVFAPGVGIKSAGHASSSASRSMSGTSMSCPHVSGAAAVFLSDGATPATVWTHMKNVAISGVITDAKNSPNLLLHVPSSSAPPGPPTTPTTAPTMPPTAAPTMPPTAAPTMPPTAAPTMPPTAAPTMPPKPPTGPPKPPMPPTGPPTPPTPPGYHHLLHKMSRDIDTGMNTLQHKINGLSKNLHMKFRTLDEKIAKIKSLLGGKTPAPTMQLKGLGCCRFDGWRAKSQGHQTQDACMQRCMADAKCVAADIARPSGNRYACYLFYGSGKNFKLQCNKSPNDRCYVKTTPAPPVKKKVENSYYQGAKGSLCPTADRITSKADCHAAHTALGLKQSKVWTGSHGGIQGGCSTRQFRYGGNHDLHWNTQEPGKARHDLTPVCKKTTPAPPPVKQVENSYYQSAKGSLCPTADRITSKADCHAAHTALGLKQSKVWTGSHGGIQGGCSTRQFRYGGNHDLHWNTQEPGKARHDLTPVCKKTR